MRTTTLFFTLLFLSACTSVIVRVPRPEVIDPEVSGDRWDFSVGTGLQPAERVKAVSDGSARPPDLGAQSEPPGLLIPIHFGLGLAENWSLLSSVSMTGELGGASYLGARWQIRGGSAKKPDQDPVALQFGVFSGSATASGTQKVVFGEGGFPWEATARYSAFEIAASAGRRLSEGRMLIYGANVQSLGLVSKVDQKAADDGTDPGGVFEKTRSGSQVGFGAGLKFGRRHAATLALQGARLWVQDVETAWIGYATFRYLFNSGL